MYIYIYIYAYIQYAQPYISISVGTKNPLIPVNQPTGNIQGELQIAAGQSDFDAAACDVWLCKGYQFADNAGGVQTFAPGQVVPMEIEIRAPHTGTANVSVVRTSTNAVLGGGPLVSFDDYASTAHSIPAGQTSFDVTIPADLGGECAAPGDCVLQWYWDARSIDQTYESCVDFVVSVLGPPLPGSFVRRTRCPSICPSIHPSIHLACRDTSGASVSSLSSTNDPPSPFPLLKHGLGS